MRSPMMAGRYKTEAIMEVGCPACAAAPQAFCDRTRDWLSPHGRMLLAAGTPPSHQERMWLRQGHDPVKFPAMRAKIRPGKFPETSTGEPEIEKQIREATRRGHCPPTRIEDAVAPPYPQRYTAIRICPECRYEREVEVVAADPWTIGNRCPAGHKWLYTAPKPGTKKTAPLSQRGGLSSRSDGLRPDL